MVRHVLLSVLKQQMLDDVGLTAVFCEVEAILNSRPITKVSDDPQDLEALTPNHILVLRSKPLLPPGHFAKPDLYHRKPWRRVQYIAQLFWKRWLLEHLPLLQEGDIGDIVLLADHLRTLAAPCGSWLLGRIIEAKPDIKGHIRVVKVRTKTSVLVRPVTKVCLILEGKNSTVKDT